MSAQQYHQQPRQRQAVQYHPASQPSNRRIPKELAEFIPLASKYEQLLAMEAKIDATITRKSYDMQDSLNRPTKVRRVMRVWCSNTAQDQSWQNTGANMDENNFDFEDGSIPAWTLRIEGRLLGQSDSATEDARSAPKFTDLVRSVVIEEDRGFGGLYTEGPILEYYKAPSSAGTPSPSLPGLEIKRKGDSDVQLKIYVTLEQAPERYKVQPKLAELLNLPEATRQEIIIGLWHYVQAEKLLDTEEKRLIHADAPLRDIFNSDRLYFPDLSELINKELLPCDPIVLDYIVRVDKEYNQAPNYWDIEVFVDPPIRNGMTKVLANLAQPDVEMQALDLKIAEVVLEIEHQLAKKEFFESYAQDPAEFIKSWLASQNEDMEVLMGDVMKVNGEAARRSKYYDPCQDWLKESVFHYLSQERV